MIKDTDKTYFELAQYSLNVEKEKRKKRTLRTILTVFLCFFFFIVGIFFGYLLMRQLHPSYTPDTRNTIGEIEYLFDNFWLYSSDYDDLYSEMENKALYGMTNFEHDPYTSYMSAEEMEQFSSSINMNYVGIGVEYSYTNNIALIKRVFKNSPAEKAGVVAGDILKKIDGISIEGMTSDDIRERVLGEEGTDVLITVLRGSETIDINIARGEVDSTVYAYQQDDYVVLQLNSFGVDSSDRCIDYLDQYKDLHKIIIDLRNNTGGYQSSVQEISGLFIGPNQVYLRQKDSRGLETVDKTVAKKTYDNFTDIVILINENTASAAEVLAICLKEQHPNVTLIGTKTYGKGVIQTNRLLNNDGVLKLTAYYWYSPNGVSIDKVGIEPDIEVKMPDIYYEYYYAMDEQETYEPDSVSESTKVAQLSLQYLDYHVARTDGYFDQSFADSLIQFKKQHNLEENAVLDKITFEAIISEVNREMSLNELKDTQLQRAKEYLNGNNS